LLVGIGGLAAGLVATKLADILIERGISDTQSNKSFLGLVVRKILGEKEIGKYSRDEFKQMLVETYNESLLKVEIDQQQFNQMMETSIQTAMQQLVNYEEKQEYDKFKSVISDEMYKFQQFVTTDFQNQFQLLQQGMVETLSSLETQRENLLQTLIEKGQSFTTGTMKVKSHEILVELRCAACGGYPLLEQGNYYRCEYCDTKYEKSNTADISRAQKLTFEKLQRLSALQLGYTTVSSRKDIQYDPERYVVREDIEALLSF
jgi:hypothetical protein